MRDAFGLVPPEIRERYERQEFVDRGTTAARAFNEALKSMDPHLSCVWVKAIDPELLPPGTLPGRWHVCRNNPPPAVATFIPITTPDGGYRDPGVDVLEELHRRDLHRPGALEEALERGRVQTRTREKAKALETEQRQDELKSDFKAAKRVAGEGGLRKRKWVRR